MNEVSAEKQVEQMAALRDAAIKQLIKDTPDYNSLLFDPQGRVLVHLDENEDIPATTVSLDIANLPNDISDFYKNSIQGAFRKQLNDAFDKSVESAQIEKILADLNKTPTGSIIALQQEFHMHLALSTRVYQKLSPYNQEQHRAQLKNAQQLAEQDVHKLIMKAYAAALNTAHTKTGINLAVLNRELDAARATIAPEAHQILAKHIYEQTKQPLKDNRSFWQRQRMSFKKYIRQQAESVTATPNDVLHTDHQTGLITWVGGNDITAHERKIGADHVADRRLITHCIDTKGAITQNAQTRTQVRVPSLAVKTGHSDQEYIKDVANKLEYLNTTYKFSPSTHAEKPAAFIYNLHTALNDTLDDARGENLQTQSARHIMLGAHAYNKEALKENKPLCLVQGISVNGFGSTLTNEALFSNTKESTLMAEMALLQTLYDHVTEDNQREIQSIFQEYHTFLQQTPSGYFCDTKAGQNAAQKIQTLKSTLEAKSDLLNASDETTRIALAGKSLMTLFKNNQHFTHEHAKLVQSLSVFLEEQSISGCKSGNERAQAINGRVAIFDALINQKGAYFEQNQPGVQELHNALATYTKNPSPENAKQVSTQLDSLYNAVGLQGAASLVSLVDQGAAAKVKPKVQSKWWKPSSWAAFQNRNNAESNLSNLSAKNAATMQAHKELSKHLLKGAKQAVVAQTLSQPREPSVNNQQNEIPQLAAGLQESFLTRMLNRVSRLLGLSRQPPVIVEQERSVEHSPPVEPNADIVFYKRRERHAYTI